MNEIGAKSSKIVKTIDFFKNQVFWLQERMWAILNVNLTVESAIKAEIILTLIKIR